MKKMFYPLLALALWSGAATAAPASEASVRQLLAVTQAQSLLEGLRGQVDGLIQNTVQQALKGKTPTPKQQQAIAQMTTQMAAVVQAELAWHTLEPMYIRLYKSAFTEQEVAGMLAFYKTPAGKAVIQKMPTLMQQTMLEVQKMAVGMGPKIQKIQDQFLADMAAAE
jgi:hypothetical protein